VAHCGLLGQGAAGWALLEAAEPVHALGAALRRAVALFTRPAPPLDAGPRAAVGGATAMMDISDGLIRDAARLAKASGVTIDLDHNALTALAGPLVPIAEHLRTDPLDWVLGGGEDHGLLATFPANIRLPHGFTAIGSVLPGGDELPPVTIAGRAARTTGWDHFAD
jgi:thiamine-monophosphate kinase